MAVPRPTKLRSSPIRDLAALVGAADPASEVAVTGVTLDSRAVLPGDLYAALPGARAHGADFAGQAAAAGAVAVLTDREGVDRMPAAGVALPAVVVTHPRAVLGAVAAHVSAPSTSRCACSASPAPTARRRPPTWCTRPSPRWAAAPG